MSEPHGAAAATEVFGLTRVWRFHLHLSAREWDTMQVRGGRRPDPAADLHRPNGYGLRFPWASAELTAGGQVFPNAGLRYKGNFTYQASANLLGKPLRIDLGRYVQGRRFHGLKKLHLANGATDPTRAREALAFGVFRTAGVPAPRTAYAEVTLTVPGRFDQEFLGLYILIEHVGNAFLKERFGSAGGLLLKPQGLRGLEHLGGEWPPFANHYRPRTASGKGLRQRLIAFTRLVNGAGDGQFRKEIGSYLDVDEFLRYLAVNGLLVNLDSFLGFGHNYYLYLLPDTNRFIFIPWDVDLAFGHYPLESRPQKEVGLSIFLPHIGRNKLIDRLLGVPEIRQHYRKVLEELTATCFTKEKLLENLEAVERATKESLAREKEAGEARRERVGRSRVGPKGGGISGPSFSLRTFLEERTASVAAQLAGTGNGFVRATAGGRWSFKPERTSR
jgi:spore coat protein CotH